MFARLSILLLVGVQTAFAFLLVAGHSRFSGETLMRFSPDHGVNGGDIPVIALWVLAMMCCAVLWTRTRP